MHDRGLYRELLLFFTKLILMKYLANFCGLLSKLPKNTKYPLSSIETMEHLRLSLQE